MDTIRAWVRMGNAQAAPSSAGVDLEACDQIDTSSWPTAVECSLQQPITDHFLQGITSNEGLDIKVGSGRRSRRWKVHKVLICEYSEYFQRACRSSRFGFQESMSSTFDLDHDNPAAFELFIEWLYSNDKQAREFNTGDASDSKAWKLYAAETCILADKLIADEFSRFALGKVVRQAHLLDIFDMETIYEDTMPTNALHLFGARWVRWRCMLQPTLWESSRNPELRSDRRQHQIRYDITDPRAFEIDHWYSPCAQAGDDNCAHRTVITAQDPSTTITNHAITRLDVPRTWSKRHRHARSMQATTPLTAFIVAFGSYLAMLGPLILVAGVLAMVVVLSARFGHCHCHGCSETCNHLRCERWCTHHFFLFCCDTSCCQCCGGFPFCCFVRCCCERAYDEEDYCCGDC